jgi:hypothetical protein
LIREDAQPHVAVVGCVYDNPLVFIIIEKQIVIRDVSFVDGMHLMFCLFYNLNLEYPVLKKKDVYYFEFVQKVLFQLDSRKLSAKLTTFG